MKLSRVWATALLALFVGALAQGDYSALRRAGQALDAGRYLAGLSQLERAVSEGRASDHGEASQFLAWVRAWVGDERGAAEAYAMSVPISSMGGNLDDGMPQEAVAAIVEAAKDRKVVILNEAHHVSLNRAFALRVALALRKQGFAVLAAEDFAPDIAQTTAKGYPTLRSGFYVRDPVYGEFVREALKAGYRLVPYEDRSGNQKVSVRDRHEAENLNDVLKRDPSARVLVYAGFNHVFEKADPSGNLWMAAMLKQLSGIDPLTIDQTTTLEKGRDKLRQASVLRKPDGSFATFGDYAGRVDLQVFHPVERYEGGRPTWLTTLLGRKSVDIPRDLLATGQRVLVQAFLPDESDDAIPYDQVVVEPKGARSRLMLKPGSYKLVVQDETGKRVGGASIEVK